MGNSGNQKIPALIIFTVLLAGMIVVPLSIHSALAANNVGLGAPGALSPHANNSVQSTPQVHAAIAYANGDVFAAIGNGQVKHFTSTGTLIETLDTTTSSTYTAGMCFDSSTNLYVTTFATGKLSKFDSSGNLIDASWATGLNADPESCVTDATHHIYVGDADGAALIYKFDSAGTQLATFSVPVDKRGTDWIDLAADQCTMHYTSEGGIIKQHNVCTDTALPDFATGLTGPCYAHRITSDGGELVACSTQVYKLDNTGAITKTYPTPSNSDNTLFALNLDPDGTSFWTGDLNSGNIYRIDIASGAVLKTFNAGINTALGGLAVAGEIAQGCGDQCGGGPHPVGGFGIPVDSTALLLAGIQGSVLWMIPAIVIAGTGITILKLRKKNQH